MSSSVSLRPTVTFPIYQKKQPALLDNHDFSFGQKEFFSFKEEAIEWEQTSERSESEEEFEEFEEFKELKDEEISDKDENGEDKSERRKLLRYVYYVKRRPITRVPTRKSNLAIRHMVAVHKFA